MRLLAQIRRMGGPLRRAATRRFRPGAAVAVACVVALLAGGIVVYLDNAERLARGRELELNQVQVLVEQLSGLEWQALVQHSSDVFSILDQQGKIVYESPAVERVLGYPVEERLGTEAAALIHSDDASLARTHMQQLASSPGAEVNAEVRVRHADGGWRRIVAFGKNLSD